MNLLYSHPHCGSPRTFKQPFRKIGYGSMRRSGYSMPSVIPSNPKLLTFQPGASAWCHWPLHATTTALCLVITQTVPDQRTPQRENYGLYLFQFFFRRVGTSAAWLQFGYACFFGHAGNTLQMWVTCNKPKKATLGDQGHRGVSVSQRGLHEKPPPLPESLWLFNLYFIFFLLFLFLKVYPNFPQPGALDACILHYLALLFLFSLCFYSFSNPFIPETKILVPKLGAINMYVNWEWLPSCKHTWHMVASLPVLNLTVQIWRGAKDTEITLRVWDPHPNFDVSFL